ncbi:MAG: SpoIIE family protein phosphatase [Flavobacteriales bacterium]
MVPSFFSVSSRSSGHPGSFSLGSPAKSRFFSVLLLLFACSSETLFLPGKVEAQISPTIESFTARDYKAHNQVFSTLYDEKNGRWFLGTKQQIISFDGDGFRRIKIGESKARSVFSMAMSNDTLWVGAKGGFGYVTGSEKGKPRYHSLLKRLPDSLHGFRAIWNTHVHERFLVFNGLQMLFIYDRPKDRLEAVELERSFYLSHLVGDSLFLQQRGTGLHMLDLGDRDPSASPERMPFNLKALERMKGSDPFAALPIKSILKHPPTGTPMVFTVNKGAFLYQASPSNTSSGRESGSWKPWSERIDRIASEHSIYDVTRISKGYAVATKFGGFYIVNDSGRVTHHFTTEQGLADNYVWAMEEGGGAIGAATDNGFSLVHIAKSVRNMIPEEEAKKEYRGTLRDVHLHQGRIYLAATQGAYRSAPLSGIGPTGDLDLKPINQTQEQINGFEELYDGSLAIIGGNGGVLHLARSELRKKEGRVKAEKKAQVHAKCMDVLHQEDQDLVAVGGRVGARIYRYRKGQWKELYSQEKVPRAILSIAFFPPSPSMKEKMGDDGKGVHLVMGLTNNGILHGRTRKDGSMEVRHLDTTQGSPPGNVHLFSYRTTQKDRKDRLLLAGTSDGTYRIELRPAPNTPMSDTCSITPYCGPDDIFCKVAGGKVHFASNGKGKLWMYGEKKVQQYTRKKGEEWTLDTLPYQALDIGTIRGFAPDPSGGIWLAGDHGIGYYDPEVEENLQKAFSCSFQRISLPVNDTGGGRKDSILYGGWGSKPNGVQLPYSHNDMKFEWTSTHFFQRERTLYRHKLEGYDQNWSSWRNKKKKAYTNLPEGEYRFRVQGKNLYGKKSVIEGYKFSVLPPWYRTWWAYGGYSLAGLGMIWLSVRLNSRRLVLQKEQLERTVADRTKEIREQKEKVEEAHQEITQSIDYAQKIQHALLQSEEILSEQHLEHFTFFKPQSQVSGDFYWFQEHKGSIYIAAVDCTGHGVPGAFMSMLGISQLNEIMNKEEELTPGFILTELRQRVVRELSGSDPESAAKDGMDAALVKIPKEGGRDIEVQFAGAQNPLYVVRKGIAEDPPPASVKYQEEVIEGDPVKPFKKGSDGIEIKGDGQPVGYDEYAKDAFTTVTLQLKKGDMLYFFSDGYADQFGGPKGKKFRYGPFKQLLASLHEKPLEEQKEELDRTFEDWKAESNQEQIDDVVVIGVRL